MTTSVTLVKVILPSGLWPFPQWRDGKIVKRRVKRKQLSDVEPAPF